MVRRRIAKARKRESIFVGGIINILCYSYIVILILILLIRYDSWRRDRRVISGGGPCSESGSTK